MMSARLTTALGVLLASAGALACDDGAGPGTGVPVSIAFSGSGTVAAEPATGSYLGPRAVDIGGTNGTLTIDELRVIVAEFELERLNDDDCAVDDDACEEFEAPPAFVNVPLDGGQTLVVTARVEPDTYDEMEFEIEDLEDDEDDPVKAQQIAQVRNEILAEFPDWPREASMLVVGTFTPTNGDPVPFRVFFEAEVEIEMDLVPPVTITDDGAGAVFTINIDPALWFRNPDGTVRNLALLDYDETGQVVEFEVEIENGFAEIEFDD